MKKIIIFLVLFLIPLKISAYCDYDSYNLALKKAGHVNIMTSYEIKENEALFTIKIYNLSSGQTIIDDTTGKQYTFANAVDGAITISNIKTPKTYKFNVYSEENTCNIDPLSTLYAEVPAYNKYYSDNVCKGIENYKLCQRWSTINMTYDEFKQNIQEYKNSLIKTDEQTDKYKSIFDYILEFYIQYYYYILPGIIILSVASILIIKKRENKFNL